MFHDLLGIYDGHAPRFAKRYGELREQMVAGVAAYASEVRSGAFPGPEHTYSIDDDELRAFEAGLDAIEGDQGCAGGPFEARRQYHPLGMPRLGDLFAPRDRAYFELFEEAGRNALLAADLLERLLVNFPDNRELAVEILECEHEGDRITHEIIDRLNHTFVTPIDREDILALASALDDIVDYTEEVADYLGLYRIEAPMDQAISLAHVLSAACQEIGKAIPLLRGFSGDLRSTRSRSTGSRTKATGSPARPWPRCSTRAIDPMVVIRWKDLFERLEAAIDSTEHVADILYGIVIKNS